MNRSFQIAEEHESGISKTTSVWHPSSILAIWRMKMIQDSNAIVAAEHQEDHATVTGHGEQSNSNGYSESTNGTTATKARKPPRTLEVRPVEETRQLAVTEVPVSSDLKEDEVSVLADLSAAQEATQESVIIEEVEQSSNDHTVVTEPSRLVARLESGVVEHPMIAKPMKYAIELTAEKLVELLQTVSKVEFFHDQHGNPFVWIPILAPNPHFECLPLGSRAFRARLVQLAESYATKPTPAAVINEAIKAGELLAFKVGKRDLANRHRSGDCEIAIDMGDEDWKMVRVSPNGWKSCPQSEPMFFRPQHVKALPEPVPGGDPFELFKYVTADTDEDKLLLLCWTVSALNPEIPSPILTFTGIQGSAKTTRSKRLRDIIDPSVTPVLGDVELSNLFLTFQHHAVPSFENVSKFDRRTADMFCRAVTGNGVERRRLFTNSDQVLYSFRRPIIINGIDSPSTRPDFLDRCIVINCQRIKAFRTLKELDAAFEEARPRLFGALLDLLARTLKLLPETPPSEEFRMADFAHFGRALAVALGKNPEDFDQAYRLNVRHQDKEALDSTPLSIAVKDFAIKYSASLPWRGSAQELLGELRSVAKRNGDHNVLSDMPKNARWLSSRLGELVTALAADGVIIDRLPRSSSVRGWKVYLSESADNERRSKMTADQRIDDDLERRDLFLETDDDDGQTVSTE